MLSDVQVWTRTYKAVTSFDTDISLSLCELNLHGFGNQIFLFLQFLSLAITSVYHHLTVHLIFLH